MNRKVVEQVSFLVFDVLLTSVVGGTVGGHMAAFIRHNASNVLDTEKD